jgi:hypothetical protein
LSNKFNGSIKYCKGFWIGKYTLRSILNVMVSDIWFLNNPTLYTGCFLLVYIYLLWVSDCCLALSPLCCMLSGEATNTSFIVLGLTRRGSHPQSSAHEASTLTITPPMRFDVDDSICTNALLLYLYLIFVSTPPPPISMK